MPDLSFIGRFVLILGVILVALGGLIWLAGRAGIPLGSLPGDFRFERRGTTCFIPIASSVILSIIVTVILNLIARWLAK